ncbi:hypothetical protein FIBSPDRAFT_868435 [Athelia psychrophila]|uniref:Uncharacterized protein n=1 Tax=Athelia psychrophila TaxID=1759441 RepID=A0A166D5H2_9AGAM|nr:hypothetical protein FIBSPDRAFT_868435 [Fibularhizoctonia sp. CBS 109695]
MSSSAAAAAEASAYLKTLQELQVVSYFTVAVLSGVAWDWLISLPEDFKIASRYKLSPTIIAYCIYILQVPFFMLSGIENKWGTQIYFFPTAGCTINNVNPGLASASLWIMAAYDTSTFLAITWRIVVLSVPMRRGLLRPSLWSVVRGDVPGLSQIGRDLLKGGQLFYFATIGVTLFGACIVFMPIPALFRLILVEPTFAISSTMACRVFRTIILRPRSRATRPQHPHGGTESSDDEDEGGKEDVQCVLTTVMPYDQEQEQGATYWEQALELHVQADLEGHANTSGRQSLGVH